jgi:hypothetical protein
MTDTGSTLDLEYTPTITPISRPTHDTPEAPRRLPATEAGRGMHGRPEVLTAMEVRWHRMGCAFRVVREWPCDCGLLDAILSIEAEARSKP